ncbi:uncharacterized protein C8A04DRAFT_15193 [Dichotomopilus funicola]|uniref:Uncharacterized protein n=1 Tax=Dichotomopilus funicola TaxID=1934379 RepID=A0AAN6ZJI4_9PEZI|nr:hypothetical protein C8A04DRAFT_15193 [Dichotomopilus funicola]
MPSSFKVLTALLATALARPSPAPADGDPVRILPWNWLFEITALEGPGCPDVGPEGYGTRPTYGSNTVDGSEIYYWHFAYPAISLNVDTENPEASIWCETTLKYTELSETSTDPADPAGYRLKLHKNGTEIIANYDLEEGVEATWTFTYDTDGDDKIVDTLTVAGPRSSDQAFYDITPPADKLVQWALPECGTGVIKYRTELSVKATKEGAKGTVTSDKVTWQGQEEHYGVQQGVSYDWDYCDA